MVCSTTFYRQSPSPHEKQLVANFAKEKQKEIGENGSDAKTTRLNPVLSWLPLFSPLRCCSLCRCRSSRNSRQSCFCCFLGMCRLYADFTDSNICEICAICGLFSSRRSGKIVGPVKNRLDKYGAVCRQFLLKQLQVFVSVRFRFGWRCSFEHPLGNQEGGESEWPRRQKKPRRRPRKPRRAKSSASRVDFLRRPFPKGKDRHDTSANAPLTEAFAEVFFFLRIRRKKRQNHQEHQEHKEH